MIGKVTSNKMTGTVAVQVDRIVIHPIYKKRLRRSQKFLAATAEPLSLGDEVEIKEVRPISRRVNFRVMRVIKRVEVLPTVKEESVGKEKSPAVKKALPKKEIKQ